MTAGHDGLVGRRWLQDLLGMGRRRSPMPIAARTAGRRGRRRPGRHPSASAKAPSSDATIAQFLEPGLGHVLGHLRVAEAVCGGLGSAQRQGAQLDDAIEHRGRNGVNELMAPMSTSASVIGGKGASRTRRSMEDVDVLRAAVGRLKCVVVQVQARQDCGKLCGHLEVRLSTTARGTAAATGGAHGGAARLTGGRKCSRAASARWLLRARQPGGRRADGARWRGSRRPRGRSSRRRAAR
jgi:hypothetical protein